MAKKNGREEEKLNYNAEVRRLNTEGAQRLYLLWGPEDYLRELFVGEIKKYCLPEGEDSFSYRRIDGPELDVNVLAEAVDALPFMTERTLVELRNVDINRLGSAEACEKLLSDIPDYCTVMFVQSAEYEPDGRMKAVKAIRKLACELKFTAQSQGALVNWIVRRYAAAGKSVELEAVQRLIFISGELMSSLIPEIEKTAAYAKGEKVTVADIEAVAHHIPEAVIFDMTDRIAQREYNVAASILAELLADKNNEPIAMLASLGMQMRRLYAAKIAAEDGLGAKYIMDACGIKYEFIANKLINSARGYKTAQLSKAVELCAEADYRIKSSGEDPAQILKETVMRIAAGERDA